MSSEITRPSPDSETRFENSPNLPTHSTCTPCTSLYIYTMGKTLIVFDFDWSFVDQDTDRWVFEVLSTPLRRLLQTRKSGGSQCTPDVV